jgi:hypothetical protein
LLAGSASFLDDIRSEIQAAGLDEAVLTHNTPPIYDWLVKTFSYQGISDQVARTYMQSHGSAGWAIVEHSLKPPASCPKLRSYWQFDGCRYQKGSKTCGEPIHIGACSLPRLSLRNGRLNQTAYSLFLFVRDIAGGDLIGWIDSQLSGAAGSKSETLQAARQEALIGSFRNVFGVSDKVLTMALSTLMMGVRNSRPDWFETGTAMVTVDTLVHNFLHRTGILQGCGTPHQFGAACYRVGGCAHIIRQIADHIDARRFNPAFPRVFPRFVQHAIWRYCAADGLNVCNGVKIDDREACADRYCRLGINCNRKPLKPQRSQ